VSTPSLVVSCTSPASASGQELEQWLSEAIVALGPGKASVYRAFSGLPGAIESVWLVAIFDAEASDSPQMASLMTEMRLLGLRPAVFNRSDASDAHAVATAHRPMSEVS
jgi:hypothetical protein